MLEQTTTHAVRPNRSDLRVFYSLTSRSVTEANDDILVEIGVVVRPELPTLTSSSGLLLPQPALTAIVLIENLELGQMVSSTRIGLADQIVATGIGNDVQVGNILAGLFTDAQFLGTAEVLVHRHVRLPLLEQLQVRVHLGGIAVGGVGIGHAAVGDAKLPLLLTDALSDGEALLAAVLVPDLEGRAVGIDGEPTALGRAGPGIVPELAVFVVVLCIDNVVQFILDQFLDGLGKRTGGKKVPPLRGIVVGLDLDHAECLGEEFVVSILLIFGRYTAGNGEGGQHEEMGGGYLRHSILSVSFWIFYISKSESLL